jgi:hypothetical protein
MEYIFALVLAGLFTLIYFYKNKKVIQTKPKAIKKEELIENYRLELFEILEKYEGNK